MKTLSLFLLGACLATAPLYAQYNTGDVELNASLSKIDADAQLDFGAFKANISAEYDISSNKIDTWSVNLGMKPGDIYLALEIGKVAQRPMDEVVNVYQKNKGQGWGVIARELGIRPGSPEFHALKNNLGGKGKGHGHRGNPHSKPD